jgi:hypothetical protein
MLRIARSTRRPGRRRPTAVGTGTGTAVRSSRVVEAVPSTIDRSMSAAARRRAHRARRSSVTWRRARLTTSSATAARNGP